MFYNRRNRMTLESLSRSVREYKAIHQFIDISTQYLKKYPDLDKAIKVEFQCSVLNILRNINNEVVISNNFKNIWFNTYSLSKHIATFGTTGRGKSYLRGLSQQATRNFYQASQTSRHEDLNAMLIKVNENKRLGFELLPISNTTDCDLIVQYKGKEMFIFISFSTPAYYIELHYEKNTLISFNSTFNQSIDIISNNIRFLFLVDNINKDYREIIEQDISAKDKIILADMLNI